MRSDIYDFYALDLANHSQFQVHGLGLGDLLDEAAQHFPKIEEDGYDEDTIRFSLIGRPNVGNHHL